MKYLKTYQLFENITSEKLYHGNRKGDFPPTHKKFGAIFLTSNLNFAKSFAAQDQDEREEFPDGGVWEVKLKPNLKICDCSQIETMKELDLKSILQKMIDDEYVDPINGRKFKSDRGKDYKGFDYDTEKEFDLEDTSQTVYNYLWQIKYGGWRIIECQPIIKAIKDRQYDGYEVTELGSKNVAIFEESSIESFDKIITNKDSLISESKKPKGSPAWHDSDAPDANGKFKTLGIKELAAWLIRTRNKDMQKITGSINQQVVFNRKKNPAYAKKMEKVRAEVKRQLGKK
jgi:hypothetical protein